VAAIDPRRSPAEASTLGSVAEAGLTGPDRPYPHYERIAASFGSHAPPRLTAKIGGPARAAADRLHAHAFVKDGRAAFAAAPSLAQAAHEAAHVVHQSLGGRPPGGVGAPGDGGERLADRAADAVVHGRSAEPLFDRVAAGTGGGGLQLMNRIGSPTVAPSHKTPWAEIAEQLDLDTDVCEIDTNVGALGGPFRAMVQALGDDTPRAETLTADLDGVRPGGGDERDSDPTQTAFGNLGQFMSYITGSSTPLNYQFEGGHLASDQLLGTDSYVARNFAPQRRQINSPIYRKIEELAEEGTEPKDSSVKKKRPDWELKAELEYLASKVSIPTDLVTSRLSIPEKAIGKTPKPPTVELTQRVPRRWKTTIDSKDPDFVFGHRTEIDTAETSGAMLGWKPKEEDVESAKGDCETHIDANYWAMDSMRHQVPSCDSRRSTGTGADRKSVHTFTAVQSVPLGPHMKTKGLVLMTPPPAEPLKLHSLRRTRSWNDIDFQANAKGPSASAKRKADEFLEDEEEEGQPWKVQKIALSRALHELGYAKQQKARGKPWSKKQALNKLKGEEDASAFLALLAHLSNNSKSNPFI
jgi:hypothetical protein